LRTPPWPLVAQAIALAIERRDYSVAGVARIPGECRDGAPPYRCSVSFDHHEYQQEGRIAAL